MQILKTTLTIGTLLVCWHTYQPAIAQITTFGSVTPKYDGSDPWNPIYTLWVGYFEDGGILIEGGSQINSDLTRVGEIDSTMAGIVTLTGAGSRLNVTGGGTLRVAGLGTVQLFNGSAVEVNNGFLEVGYNNGDNGMLIVDNSMVTTGRLTVGYTGSGKLCLLNGGLVEALGPVSMRIGETQGVQGSVFVSGQDTKLNSNMGYVVGLQGEGLLEVNEGGLVSSESSGLIIGEQLGSTGTVIVDGTDSALDIPGSIILGQDAGGFGELTIANGGNVDCVFASAGFGSSSAIGSVLIEGLGSTWNVDTELVVGSFGIGFVQISAGGQVASGIGTVGESIGAIGTVVVEGTGSNWTTDSLNIGFSIKDIGGGFVEVNNGAAVQAANTINIMDTGGMSINGGNLAAAVVRLQPGGIFIMHSGNLDVDLIEADEMTIEGGNDSFNTLGSYSGATPQLNFEGGVLKPGGSADNLIGHALISDGGNVQLSGGTLGIELQGPNLSMFDRLTVQGALFLSGTALNVNLISGFTLSGKQEFLIVDVLGTATGQFAGLPEGAVVDVFDGTSLFITYTAGDGNEIALYTSTDPEVVLAEGFSVIRGLQVDGTLADVHASDDLYLQFNPGITLNSAEAPVWLEFESTLPTETPSTFMFTLEARANTFGLVQKIALFNYSSGIFEEVYSENATTTDSVAVVTTTGDISRFVEDGSGAIKTKLAWQPVGPVLLNPWLVRVDQVKWEYLP